MLTDGVEYRATLTGGPDGVTDLAVPANDLLEDVVWTFTAVAPTGNCVEPARLQTAEPFGPFGGSAGVTNQGLLTIINGDLGTTAASTLVTGFVSEPDCAYTITTLNEGQVNGKIYTAPPPPTVACPQDGTAVTQAIADQARLDAEEAFIALSPANLPGGQDPGNDNLGNLTLAPGIYTAQSGAFSIQGGDLTLDGQGNQNAVWIFQMATTLTVGGPGADFPQSVTLTNGAQAKNIFWQVGSAATINAAGGGFMKGTIIAQDGVSISTAGQCPTS
ncbi:MAG: ice-binding family protein [Gammaproteobacteria bacterium]|nr:ice-binding family protein [Gammaproteobacteria bacterium]